MQSRDWPGTEGSTYQGADVVMAVKHTNLECSGYVALSEGKNKIITEL
jgi:hypothetical protein